MDDVRQHFHTDPRHTYLTGQSMGGHGAWHLGVTYPDLFAAIGPNGGWPSFWSYGGGMPDVRKPRRDPSADPARQCDPATRSSLLT